MARRNRGRGKRRGRSRKRSSGLRRLHQMLVAGGVGAANGAIERQHPAELVRFLGELKDDVRRLAYRGLQAIPLMALGHGKAPTSALGTAAVAAATLAGQAAGDFAVGRFEKSDEPEVPGGDAEEILDAEIEAF